MNDSSQLLSVIDAQPAAKQEAPHEAQPVQRTGPYDALVLDAKLRQSLVTVRSLGKRGLRVAAS